MSEFLRDRNVEVYDVHTEDLNYRMILADRIDAYPTSQLVGRYDEILRQYLPEGYSLNQ